MGIEDGSRTLAYVDEGHGPPVVLLHAFPLDGRMWDEQRKTLAKTHRVVVPDLAGFGRSRDSAPRASLDAHADDVAALLSTLGIARATVVGLSMGGYIALAFARRHPERLLGLGLADTRALPDSPEGRAARDQNIALVEREGVAPLVERMLPKLLSERASPGVVDRVRAIGASQSAEGVISALSAMRDRPDSTSLLAHIDTPTAVIVGSLDAISTSTEMRDMAERLPRGDLTVVDGVGHLANLESALAFTGAVRKLLERANPASAQA